MKKPLSRHPDSFYNCIHCGGKPGRSGGTAIKEGDLRRKVEPPGRVASLSPAAEVLALFSSPGVWEAAWPPTREALATGNRRGPFLLSGLAAPGICLSHLHPHRSSAKEAMGPLVPLGPAWPPTPGLTEIFWTFIFPEVQQELSGVGG